MHRAQRMNSPPWASVCMPEPLRRVRPVSNPKRTADEHADIMCPSATPFVLVHSGPALGTLDRDHGARCRNLRGALLAAHLCDRRRIPSIHAVTLSSSSAVIAAMASFSKLRRASTGNSSTFSGTAAARRARGRSPWRRARFLARSWPDAHEKRLDPWRMLLSQGWRTSFLSATPWPRSPLQSPADR